VRFRSSSCVPPKCAASSTPTRASVIQLALEQGVRTVCIDERAGRRIATAVGLDVVGTLGLLLQAKTSGLLDALRPVIARLAATGAWYDEALVRRVLEAAGE
jgi:predicted nucleic acid-binding protein